MPSFPGGVGLMIGYPIAGHPVVPEMMFVPGMLSPPMNYDVRAMVLKGRPVAEARQAISDLAEKENCKYLFFQGDDVGTPAYALRQMCFHMEHNPKMAVIGGVYCRKTEIPEPLVFRGNGQGCYWDWKVGELFECSGVGMDCTLIRVEALKDIQRPWFVTVDSIDQLMDGVNKLESWTEDLYLCQKLTAVKDEHGNQKWEVWCDASIIAPHYDWQTGKAFTLPPSSKPMRRAAVEKGAKKIIDLGCGRASESYSTPEGDTIRVDIRDDVQPDYRCDIRKLPFNTGEFDVVFSSHTLEHFPVAEVGPTIDEWIRVMKPTGELRLVLPNLAWAAEQIAKGEVSQDVMNVLYGAQTYDENFHKVGFTPQMLEKLLRERGFVKFVWDFAHYHMLCRAWKVVPKEEPGTSLESPAILLTKSKNGPAYSQRIEFTSPVNAGPKAPVAVVEKIKAPLPEGVEDTPEVRKRLEGLVAEGGAGGEGEEKITAQLARQAGGIVIAGVGGPGEPMEPSQGVCPEATPCVQEP